MYLYARDIRNSDGALCNFESRLNLWIWPRLLPEAFTRKTGMVFFGVGSLLTKEIPAEQSKVVFGSGIQSTANLPVVDNSWKFYCIRGPRSAKALGIPQSLALTDSAYLIRRMDSPQPDERGYKVGLMPCGDSGQSDIWKEACGHLGIHFIEPTWPIEKILGSIRSCEMVLTETVHGAVAADALRIPWVPVMMNKTEGNQLCWLDWCESVLVSYNPRRIYPLVPLADSSIDRAGLRYTMGNAAVRIQLSRLIKTAKPSLSSDTVCNRRTEQLLLKLELLRRDLASGQLF